MAGIPRKFISRDCERCYEPFSPPKREARNTDPFWSHCEPCWDMMEKRKMRQAIVTRYTCNSQGAGFVNARADAGRIRVPWDHKLDTPGNHKAAAMALAAKLGWEGSWRGGSLPGAGYVFTTDSEDGTFSVCSAGHHVL